VPQKKSSWAGSCQRLCVKAKQPDFTILHDPQRRWADRFINLGSAGAGLVVAARSASPNGWGRSFEALVVCTKLVGTHRGVRCRLRPFAAGLLFAARRWRAVLGFGPGFNGLDGGQGGRSYLGVVVGLPLGLTAHLYLPCGARCPGLSLACSGRFCGESDMWASGPRRQRVVGNKLSGWTPCSPNT